MNRNRKMVAGPASVTMLRRAGRAVGSVGLGKGVAMGGFKIDQRGAASRRVGSGRPAIGAVFRRCLQPVELAVGPVRSGLFSDNRDIYRENHYLEQMRPAIQALKPAYLLAYCQ